MTDEEKETIKTFENFLDDISKNGGCTIDIDYRHKKEYESMWIVLNLIEKQQAEINKYKEMLAVSVADRVNSAFEQKYKNDEDLEMLYKGCQIELEEKDKYINNLENKLMYALSPTTHELALNTQEQFKAIIRDNLEEDTYTIKRALKEYWEDK